MASAGTILLGGTLSVDLREVGEHLLRGAQAPAVERDWHIVIGGRPHVCSQLRDIPAANNLVSIHHHVVILPTAGTRGRSTLHGQDRRPARLKPTGNYMPVGAAAGSAFWAQFGHVVRSATCSWRPGLDVDRMVTPGR